MNQMGDRDKGKEQLLNELMELRTKITELEHIKANQKQTEKKLAKSEELYRLIAENTSDVITLTTFNLHPVCTYVSPSIKANTGYEPEELIGKSPFTFIHPDDKKKLFSMLKNYVNTKVKKLFTGKESFIIERIEYRFKGKEGDWRYVQSTGNIVGNKILFITRDITDQKKVEETLRRSHQEFISLFKSNPEAIVYVDEKSNILDINPRFTKLFGYSLEEIKSRNVNDGMIHPSDRIEEGKALDRKTFSTGYSNYETIRKKKDGTLFPVSLSSSPVIINNQVKGGLGIYIDITERKQNERLQQILYNTSKAASSPITLDQLYPLIHRWLGAIIDSTNFYIALVDKKEDKILFPYYVDEKDENFSTLHLSDSNSLTVSIIKTGQPLLINYEQINQKIDQGILIPVGTITDRSIWLGVPFKIEDRVIGAMVIQSYTNPELYSEKDIKLLELISSQVATAIERKSTEEKIKHLRFHDSLTDLYNRAYFEEELERYNSPLYYPLSIVVIDVNGLKAINDTFGHIEGDRLLQHLSQILTSVSRKGDIIARVGGDEFAFIMPSTTSKQVHDFCQRIRKVCEEDTIKPIFLRPSISLGHATQEGGYKEIETLLKEADDKMYQDKLFQSKTREKYLLDSFLLILAERDTHINDHSQRLQELALSLGKRVGLTEYQLGNLKLLALLHDIGKIGIPDSILFKTNTLTPSEWKKMREHSRIGYRMAKNIPDFAPIAHEILCHHEHWDGKGYPEGLKGEDIPLLSRIISIVDAYDVMQSRRPYKGAISKAEALKEVKRCAGTQFDPQLVEIFLKIVKNKASRERK